MEEGVPKEEEDPQEEEKEKVEEIDCPTCWAPFKISDTTNCGDYFWLSNLIVAASRFGQSMSCALLVRAVFSRKQGSPRQQETDA